MQGSFSAAGVSTQIVVRPGQSFTYAFTVGGGDAFVGVVRLESSRRATNWVPVVTLTGTALVPLEGAAGSGTVINSEPHPMRYRFACLSVGEISEGVPTDAIACSTAEGVDELRHFRNPAGVDVLVLTDEGIEAPKVTATVLEAPGELIDFSAVPTTDPAVAGRLWLDTGVLKISAGVMILLAFLLSAGGTVAAQSRTMFPSTAMLTDVIATGSSQAFKPATGKTTYQAWGTTTAGAGAATIVIEVSNVEVPTADTDWITAGTITLTLGTAKTTDGFAMAAAWRNVRARVSAISGTNAKVSVRMGGGQ